MAWVDTPDTSKWVQKLNNGSTATGSVATVNVNMGALEYSRWDPDKAGAILEALDNVVSKTIYRSVRTVDYLLESQ